MIDNGKDPKIVIYKQKKFFKIGPGSVKKLQRRDE